VNRSDEPTASNSADAAASAARPTAALTALAAELETAVRAALDGLARRDPRAVEALHDLVAPNLMAIALRVTASYPDAEEVVQDALTRAWNDSASYDPGRGSALAWLVTLTRNRAIDLVRSRCRRTNYETASSDDGAADEPTSPEQAVAAAENVRAVRRLLGALTPDQRRALDIAYYDGLTHREIADRLGEPLGTVKSRILQAVARLRDALAAEQIGSEQRRVGTTWQPNRSTKRGTP
jgi:RNA polymerase sigma-70 factor (ECF subfamily)